QIGDGARTRVRTGLSEASDFMATGGKEGTPPQSHALVLKRGYIMSRSGWGQERRLEDESHMLIRYGEVLKPRVHSHYDRGSVHIYANGQPWLVDSGFHSYQPSAPENQYLISRESHNLATVTGLDHTPDAPVRLVNKRVTKNIHDFT